MKNTVSASRERGIVRRGVAATCLAVLATAIVAACISEIEITRGGVKVKISTQPDGSKSGTVSGGVPPGKCVKVEFTDKNGNPVGSATTTVPGKVPVPPNTADGHHTVVDCPDDAPNGDPDESATPFRRGSRATSTSAPTHSARQLWPQTVDVYGFPVTINMTDGGLFKNATYHFRVTVSAGVDPFLFVRPILIGGPGTPVPPNVQVVSFTQLVPDAQGARVIAAATRTFDQFRLDWNDHAGYADLASGSNAIQTSLANDWRIVESFIQAQDCDTQPLAVNVGTTTRKTEMESAPDVETVRTTNP